MKKTPTMKLLYFLLAALTVFSAVLLSHQYQTVRDMRKAQVASRFDHAREQIQSDDDDYRKQEAEAEDDKNFTKQVEALQKKVHAYAGNELKTLTNPKP